MLLEYKDKNFLVIHPSGGKGDELIFMGMQKVLNQLHINYKTFKYNTTSVPEQFLLKLNNKKPKMSLSITSTLQNFIRKIYTQNTLKNLTLYGKVADVAIIRGGAYLNDIWRNYEILENVLLCHPKFDIIIAPHSFYFLTGQFKEILDNTTCNIHLFCREKYSYNLIQSMNLSSNIKVYLSHDTSLYLRAQDFTVKREEKPYILIAPRKDREGVVSWRMDDNPTNVKVLFGDVEDVRNFSSWINVIGNSYEVYTDRLHVAILSAILGKETFLYPTLYHKNKGVYEYGLRNFPNVKFIDSYEFLGLNQISVGRT